MVFLQQRWYLLAVTVILVGALIITGCNSENQITNNNNNTDQQLEVEVVEPEVKVYLAFDQVPLRQGPGGHHELISYETYKQEYIFVEESVGWTKVKNEDKEGWIYSQYLTEKVETEIEQIEETNDIHEENNEQDDLETEKENIQKAQDIHPYEHIPKLKYPDNPPVKVKGIYATKNVIAGGEKWNRILQIVEETEVNAIVMDVKNDDGLMLYQSKVELAEKVGANSQVSVQDIESLMAHLNERGIFPIARIVVFKDPLLAKNYQEVAIKNKDGTIYSQANNVYWVNPFDRRTWEYHVEIAKEAAKLGFREIQFDYVRFPENAQKMDARVNYEFVNQRTKEEAISEFLTYARQELEPYQVYVSADVFGFATTVKDHMGIGQKWEPIANVVDYICPMIYPSHYGPGIYGYANPNAHPYGVVDRAVQDGIKRSDTLIDGAIMRPWLQDFSMGSPKYGASHVREQIKALEDNGIEEWLLWNAGNNYTVEALKAK